MAIHLRRILGPAVRLSADASGERHPIWIQAATEGVYRGHPAHDKIEFDAPLFDEVIRNFRANPSFKAGENGLGEAQVIRLDYEHTSEMNPMQGAVPVTGLPAPGWVLDLQLRDGSGANVGKLELWALVLPNEQLWGQIEREEYLWTSVAIDPKAVDRVSGQAIGNCLTSLAITNNPFIIGMAPMNTNSTESKPSKQLASAYGFCLLEDTKRRGANRMIVAAMDMWGEAETPEEALVGLRGVFGLGPEATAADALLELGRFEKMLADKALPEGVDAQSILYRIRGMFGLKVLSTQKEIIDAAKAAVAKLVENDGAGGGTSSTANQSAASTPSAAAPETKNMSAKTLASRLATCLKLSADADDDAVVDAVKSQLLSAETFKSRLAKKLGVVVKLKAKAESGDEDKLLEAVGEAADAAEGGSEAKSALDKLLEILESKDVVEVLSKATALTEKVKKHGDVVEQLNALTKQLADGQVKQAEEEVEAIAACHKIEDRTKRLLTMQVIREEKDAEGKVTSRTVNLSALEQIRKDWPLPKDSGVKQLLTTSVFAGPNGQQLGGAATGAPPATTTITPEPAASPLKDTQAKVMLCNGRNEVEKAITYLCANELFAALPYGQQVFEAGQFWRTGKSNYVPAGASA